MSAAPASPDPVSLAETRESVRAEIERTLRLLFPDGCAWEIRAPKTKWRVVSGYYTDATACARDVMAQLEGHAEGIYVTINPVQPDLAARANGRLKRYADTTTSDDEIVRRRRLLIDIDSKHPRGVSATDAEREAAHALAHTIIAWLTAEFGWSAPIFADSGNGAHILFLVDLPNDADTRQLVDRLLKLLAARWDDNAALVDTSTGNAARCCKLYGTAVKKGDSTADRPHRRSRLLDVPDALEIVTCEQIEAVCARLEAEMPQAMPQEATQTTQSEAHTSTNPNPYRIDDVPAWLERLGVEYRERPADGGTRRYELRRCPWNGHGEWKLAVLCYPNGNISASCRHADCAGKHLRDLRDAWEPGWRDRQNGSGRHERTSTNSTTHSKFADDEEDPEIPVGYVEPFPFDTLPSGVRAFVRTAATAIYCPPDYVAMPLLGYAGAAIGNSACLQIKRGWHEYARFWIAPVGDPSSGKTPAMDAARHELDERQREIHETWDREYTAWRQQQKGEDGSGEEPRLRQLYTVDTTMEALGDLLHDNRRGVVVARDEISGWALAMNEYKRRGSDREHWLTLWGGGSLMVNRRARRHPLYIARPFVSVVGGIQPDKLGELCDERGRNDGFIHRMLFVYPNAIARKWTDAEVADEAYVPIHQLFEALYGRQMGDGDKPMVVEFTPLARDLWREMMNDLYAMMWAPDFPDALRGPWGKLDRYIARLALVIHLMRAAFDKSIAVQKCDDDSLSAAGDIADYLKSHIRRVYARLAASPSDARLLHIVSWIREHGGTCTARDLYHAHVAGITTSDDAEATFADIAGRGWGRVDTITNVRGKATIRFTLHEPTVDKKAGGES